MLEAFPPKELKELIVSALLYIIYYFLVYFCRCEKYISCLNYCIPKLKGFYFTSINFTQRHNCKSLSRLGIEVCFVANYVGLKIQG